MAINSTSAFIGTAWEELFGRLVLGAETIDKGLLHIIPSKRNNVYLNRFRAPDDLLRVRVAEPTATQDYTKDEKTIVQYEAEFYAEWNPRDFGIENWKFLWGTGTDVDTAPANELRRMMLEATVDMVNNGCDRLIWQADSLSGDDSLNFGEGLIKLLAADVTVIDTTPAAISASNVVSIFEAIVAAMPAPVREKATSKLIMDHASKYAYQEASRALSFKGTDISDAQSDRFGGFEIVSVGGMPASTVVMADASTSGNLKMATWMTNDRNNVQVEPKNAHSDLWFTRVAFTQGCEYVNGDEIVLHQAS